MKDRLGRTLDAVDERRAGSRTLQAHRFPHNHEFIEDARTHQDQVATTCGINRRLDRATCRDTDGRIVADRDRDAFRCADAGSIGHDELVVTVREVSRHRPRNRGVRPLDVRSVERDATQRHGAFRTTETEVSSDRLFGSRTGRQRPFVGRVGHCRDALRMNGERLALCDQRTRTARTVDLANLRFAICRFAIRRVIAGGESRHGHDRCIQIGRRSRHVLERVAEVAVRRVELRIRNQVVRIRRIGDRARIVHARHEHRRGITARRRHVGRERRGHEPVHPTPLVRVDPRDLVALVVANRDRHERRRPFLAELRRQRVELLGRVVEDHTCEASRYRRAREQEEVRGCLTLVG